MRKVLFIIPLLVLLMMDNTGFAQLTVVNSRTRAISKPYGKDATVRFFGSGGDMFVYNWDYVKSTHVFTCRRVPTHPDANRYEFPIMFNAYGQIQYTIEDIVVVDKMCFFCGTETVPTLEYDASGNPYVVDQMHGYIGQMRLDHMTDVVNGEVKYRIHTITNTKELKRIDAIVSRQDPSDTLLGLVGTSVDGKSSYLLMKERVNGLIGEIFKVTNSNEEFTDMVFCTPNFAIASRFSGEHYTFGMRSGDINENYYVHVHTNDLYYLNKFNTSTTIEFLTNTNTTWHRDNVDIRLCQQQGYHVYLAYESFEGDPIPVFPASQTSLFLMEANATSDIQIITLQNVDSGVKDTGAFTDMVYVPRGNQVALLHKNTKTYSPWKGVMQLTTNPPGAVMSTFSSTDDETLTSLDIYNSEQVWAVGNRPSHNDSVVLFYQHAAYPSPSCYNYPIYHTAELEPLDKADRQYVPLIVNTLDINTSPWRTMSAQKVDITQRCIKKAAVSTDLDGDTDLETDGETDLETE
jgi:hypothetical protein